MRLPAGSCILMMTAVLIRFEGYQWGLLACITVYRRVRVGATVAPFAMQLVQVSMVGKHIWVIAVEFHLSTWMDPLSALDQLVTLGLLHDFDTLAIIDAGCYS